MTASTELSKRDEFLAYVLTTAVEGGIGYWSRIQDYEQRENGTWVEITLVDYVMAEEMGALDKYEGDLNPLWSGMQIVDELYEAGKIPKEAIHKVTLKTIAKGLGIVRKQGVSCYDASIMLADRDNDAGEIDSCAADVIVQAGIFGKILYG